MKPDPDLYAGKATGYFGHVREDVIPLLPPFSHRILEIGCGDGHTLAYLKETGRCEWTCGIDPYGEPERTGHAHRIDSFFRGGIESTDLGIRKGSLDLILCLDVLEHLIDPWRVSASMVELLRPGGHLIVSLPNVRHYSVLLPLAFAGRWKYEKEGILDATHLRFFTRETALALVQQTGAIPMRVLANGLSFQSKAGIANLLTFGAFRRIFEYQYLISAVKPLPSGKS